jgi:hypothetical protein
MNEGSQKIEKKKGLWALLKESIAKSNAGCGPGCGCHAAAEKKDKGGEVAGKGNSSVPRGRGMLE